MKAVVTGGAGFIGSRLCRALLAEGYDVVAFDNLSSGSELNLRGLTDDGRFAFVRGDCKRKGELWPVLRKTDIVFHFAAQADVRIDHVSPSACFQDNVLATEVLLEGVISSGVGRVIFASSSTVYGESDVRPTPEDYSPLAPISVYGASKLASEALLLGYAESYGFGVTVLRLANIVGEGSPRGVVHDFAQRLRSNPSTLEILGDGTQSKSYLYVDDCVDAVLTASQEDAGTTTYNVGSQDQIDVVEVAEVVCRAMRVSPSFSFKKGADGGRGWPGDIKSMLLDIRRIKALGWKPRFTSRQAVETTALRMVSG